MSLKDQILPRPTTGDGPLDDFIRRSARAAALPQTAQRLSASSLPLEAIEVVWDPWGDGGARVVSVLVRATVAGAVATRLYERELMDGATTKVTMAVVARSIGGNSYAVDVTAVYKRTGSTVSQLGTTSRGGEVEDVTAYDATPTTSGTLFVLNVTGAGTTNWSSELRFQEQR